MRILSYNIQASIASSSYWSYAWYWHRQILPSRAKTNNLQRIAQFIDDFDVVCLQEIDLGGLRNGFRNQVDELCAMTGFTHAFYQTNRVVGSLSRHGNVILCRQPAREVVNVPLPSRIAGRGFLAVAVDTSDGELVIANVHLSLGAIDQLRQLRFIREHLRVFDDVCLMGDFNCAPEAEQLHTLTDHGYVRWHAGMATYPSWNPKQTLDHVFVKGRWQGRCSVQGLALSDHLPVIVQLDEKRKENEC